MPITDYAITIPPIDIAFDHGSYSMRATYTQARRAYMEGGWGLQLANVMASLLTREALANYRCLDLSHNPFKDVITKLATRYHEPVAVTEGEIGDLDVQDLFSEHPEAERCALAYNAAAVSLRVVNGAPVVEVLPPDHVDVKWNDAGDIDAVRLARPIPGRGGGHASRYIVEEWDLTRAAHSVLTGGKWVVSPTYPWRYATGEPFAPVVIVRAEKTPDWWGANRWPELIEATLEEGVSWTIHRYGRLNSSTGIPYVMDVTVANQAPDDSGEGSKQVTASAQNVVQLNSRTNNSGKVGVLQATFDAEKDVEAIMAAFNARMSSMGLGDSALQRAGAESGYAIILRREGLLRIRKSTEVMFRRADQELIRKAVACLRIFANGVAESERYKVTYAPVPAGSAENGDARAQEKHDLDIGVATPESIYAARNGVSLEDASRRIAEIRALMNQVAPTSPAAVVGSSSMPPIPRVAPVVQPSKVDREEYPFVGFVDFQGLRIDIENRKGDTRRGVNTDGTPWQTVMGYDYGEIRGTRGTDGDKLDVFVGPLHDSPLVVAINQHDPVTGGFDEQKIMLGFETVEEAVSAYRAQYDSPGFYVEGDYEVMSFGAFWRAVKEKRFHGKRIDGTELHGRPVPRSGAQEQGTGGA